jgi:hypothetical protein
VVLHSHAAERATSLGSPDAHMGKGRGELATQADNAVAQDHALLVVHELVPETLLKLS